MKPQPIREPKRVYVFMEDRSNDGEVKTRAGQVRMREAGFRETWVEHLIGPDSMVVGIK